MEGWSTLIQKRNEREIKMDTKNVVLRVQQRLLEDVGLKTNKQDA